MIDGLEKNQPGEGRQTMAIPVSIWTRNFTLLCLANLVLFMSTQMLFPSLPVYLLKIGGNQSDIGYVMGAYTISSMVIRPFAGWFVDSYGRKKIMILGMVMMLAVSLLYKLAGDVLIMTLIRSLHGMGFGLVSTAIGTIVADSLPTARLSEGMGYFGLTSYLSMALAPLIGFWLVGMYGYPMLFLGVSLLTGLAFGSTLFDRSPKAPIKASAGSSATGIWANLLEKTALSASMVMFFLAVVYGSVLSFISLYAVERGIANIGLFFTALALAMLVSRPISGRWADSGGTNRVLVIGHLALFVGMVTTGLSHNIMGFLLAGAFIGLGFGFCLPTLQAIAVRHAPAHRRGAATGTFFAAFDSGIGLGTIIWGYVVAATSYQFMYFTTLLPVVLAGAIYYRFTATTVDVAKSK
jgi:MFS family permease